MKKILPFILLVCVLFFQNCGLPFSGAQSGNGNGYGGYKIEDGSSNAAPPRLFNETSSTICPDGTRVQSSIVYTPVSAMMIRENCMDLVPSVQLDMQEIRMSGAELSYRGRLYRSE